MVNRTSETARTASKPDFRLIAPGFGRSQGNQPEVDRISFRLNLSEVVAIQIHNLVPGSREVLHERTLRVVAGIDLCESAELGV